MVTSTGVTGRLEPKEKAAKIRIAAMNEANFIFNEALWPGFNAVCLCPYDRDCEKCA